MMIRVEDLTERKGYRFVEPSSYRRLTLDEIIWTQIPRVGDHLLDRNEIKFVVIEVLWYDPYSVTLKVKQA